MKKQRTLILLLLSVLFFTILWSSASADRILQDRPKNYIGAMRVVWCKEWISLREKPSKLSKRIAEIPLGSIVYSCVDIGDPRFYQCEYEGQTGYALIGYLWPAPECEPPLSSSITRKMTMEEVAGTGETVLEWNDYNMNVTAAHEWINENGKKWEVLRIGCFINGSPIWGHEERAEEFGQGDQLKVFIGGIQDDWQIMVFNGAYGLSLLDLLSGKERWCITTSKCPMGPAAHAVDENGTVYMSCTDGQNFAAVSLDGQILWQSEVSDPDLSEPYEMNIDNGNILVKYQCGMENGYRLVTFDGNGRMLNIREMENEPAGGK